MLMKRKTFEAGLSQGMNPKRKMIRTSPKTAELNKKVVEIVDKCNIKGIPVSGVQLRETVSVFDTVVGFCSFTELLVLV